MDRFANDRNRSRRGRFRPQRTARSRETNSFRGIERDLAWPRRISGFSQLQYVNRRKRRGGLIQIRPAALLEDLLFFEAEGRFDERKRSKSASLKGSPD